MLLQKVAIKQLKNC